MIAAEVKRGELTESVHHASVAVVNTEGKLVYFYGNPMLTTFTRSSLKPFQALAVLASGAADYFKFTDEEIAIISSSHSGSPTHTNLVKGILHKLGLDETALECGTHMPYDEDERKRLIREGLKPSPLHHNCSGKHAGMLALAKVKGWDHRGYRFPHHPVQEEIRRILRSLTGMEQFPEGIDGCGVPVFGMPLYKLAHLFAMLGTPESSPYPRELKRIRDAMKAHPILVGGKGRFDTSLMENVVPVVAKAGAEAMFGVALMDMGLGIAVKIEDGGRRAIPPVVMKVLENLGVITPAIREKLRDFAMPPVKNAHRETVGYIKAVLNLAKM